MRLDKFLCELNIGSRSQVKEYIRKGLVTVNSLPAIKPEQKIDANKDRIALRGEALFYKRFVYYMLNKPAGVVSATRDNTCKTVLDLITLAQKKELFPVGRLDKDTEGLLLITNDGELAHAMLSPKRHVNKTYLVGIEKPLLPGQAEALEQGVDIGEDRRTLPARVEILSDSQITLTIREGKFHQVKRMLQAVDNRVLTLKRLSFGPLSLDEKLPAGAYRELTEQEVALLYEYRK